MSFNFKGVESAKAGSYLKPGYYRVRVTEVESGEFDSGIPYVAITFSTKENLSITEKFTLKTKDPNSKFNPLSRLQYLHEAWLGTELDAEFKTLKDVAVYFKKALVNKTAGVKTLLIGGEINGKITYGRIPLTDFIKDGEVELGEFAEDSDEYKQHVKKSTRTTEASGKKGGILNGGDDDDDFADDDDDDDDEETPAPAKSAAKKSTDKKATDKAPAKPAKAAKATAKESDANSEDDKDGEDFDW